MTISSMPLFIAQTPPAGGAPLEIVGVPNGSGTTTQPAAPGSAPAATGAVTPGTGAPAGGPPPQQPGFGMTLMLPMLLLIGVMIATTVMSGRKEKKKRAELMTSMSRNDRVQTIGGIIGTIVEMSDDEVVLRVDETSNTRIRFSKAAVQQVLRKNASGGGNGTSASQAESKPALAKAGA